MRETMYVSSLKAMKYLFGEMGDEFWLDQIGKDIQAWETNKDAEQHLRLYGGMGSLNDVCLCTENGHKVRKEHAPWLDPLLEWLRSICHYLAQNPELQPSYSDLKNAIGHLDAMLSAFVGGEHVPDDVRRLDGFEYPLEGWRCRDCGHGEITSENIERYLAQTLLPPMILGACAERRLISIVDDVLDLNIEDRARLKREIEGIIDNSEVTLSSPREGWMRPCPSCGAEDTGVHRWIIDGNSLKPSSDN